MQTKSDTSYGIIPLYKKEGKWEVFLINQIGRRGDTFWTFPKGHPEPRETPKETALRELLEETGMVPKEILAHEPLIQTYEFVHEDVLVQKQSFYFLGLIEDKHFAVQASEVTEAGWFSFDDAIAKLTHAQAKEMLTNVTFLVAERI
jgi:8-oxo-dGTP pyrophosphatase MutT (NUDIX family)